MSPRQRAGAERAARGARELCAPGGGHVGVGGAAVRHDRVGLAPKCHLLPAQGQIVAVLRCRLGQAAHERLHSWAPRESWLDSPPICVIGGHAALWIPAARAPSVTKVTLATARREVAPLRRAPRRAD